MKRTSFLLPWGMKQTIFLLPLAIVVMLFQIWSGASADDSPKIKKDKKDEYIAALQAKVSKLDKSLADKNDQYTRETRELKKRLDRLEARLGNQQIGYLTFTKGINYKHAVKEGELESSGPQPNLRHFAVPDLPPGARFIAAFVTHHDNLSQIAKGFNLIEVWVGTQPGSIDYDIRSNTDQAGHAILRFHVFYDLADLNQQPKKHKDSVK